MITYSIIQKSQLEDGLRLDVEYFFIKYENQGQSKIFF